MPLIERALREGGFTPPGMTPADHVRGALTGIVDVRDGFWHGERDWLAQALYDWMAAGGQDRWAFGKWCAPLADVRAFVRPIPWRGRQGTFQVPDEVVADAIATARTCVGYRGGAPPPRASRTTAGA